MDQPIQLKIKQPLMDSIKSYCSRFQLTANVFFEQAAVKFLDEQTQHGGGLQTTNSTAEKIQKGHIYWVSQQIGSAAPHPQVILQENYLNNSRIPSVVVCGLTTNLERINYPGNVLLEPGEANLPKQSLVEVSKISVVDKGSLGTFIGTLSMVRMEQIQQGIEFLQKMTDSRR